MRPKQFQEYVISHLEDIVIEAREGGFFSIDEIDDLANNLKSIKVKDDIRSKVENWNMKDWGALMLAWVLVPFIVCALPFAWIWSQFKR